MAPLPPSVFVSGVTGNQGGAIARRLLNLGWTVHSTARNLDAPKSIALAAAGVKLTQGDWDNENALRASLSGCNKVFLNLFPTLDDFDRERLQAVRIVEIAKNAGVKQVVSSTSLGVSLYGIQGHLADALKPGTIIHQLVKVKKEIEETIKDGGFDACTFLRPGYFMANFLEPVIDEYTEILNQGTWSTVFGPDTQLGLIDHDDIAKVAIAAFQDPDRFNGREIGLVSEFLSPQEVLNNLAEAMRRPGLKAVYLSDAEIAALDAGPFENPYLRGDKCLELMGELVDMQELGTIVPLTTFKAFLQRESDKVKRG